MISKLGEWRYKMGVILDQDSWLLKEFLTFSILQQLVMTIISCDDIAYDGGHWHLNALRRHVSNQYCFDFLIVDGQHCNLIVVQLIIIFSWSMRYPEKVHFSLYTNSLRDTGYPKVCYFDAGPILALSYFNISMYAWYGDWFGKSCLCCLMAENLVSN